jgi:hypothetical protein
MIEHDTKALPVSHVIRGRVIEERSIECPAPDGVTLFTPKLNPDELVWTRTDGFPAMNLSLDEIIAFLAATGGALEKDASGYVNDALINVEKVNPVGGGQLRRHMASAIGLFDPDLMRREFDSALGYHPEGWKTVDLPNGEKFQQRWMPTRTVHVLAGNTPHGGPQAIIRTALVRGVALMKLPSNDPFTPIAVLKTMRDLDPNHPLVDSFSAVYWRGGDANVESVIFRPQFFEKIIAWGGESAIKNAVKYLGPGIELISFDPKTSISIIDTDGLEDPSHTEQVAALAANDVRYQEGCATSRHQYVRGTVEEVDQYCAALLTAMHDFHDRMQGSCKAPPPDLVEAVDALRFLEPDYRVWGKTDGSGLVVRSLEPVDFYPDCRTVNVVRVENVDDVVGYVNEATQTVGVYPPERKFDIRDRLIATGSCDRIGDLGNASAGPTGGLGGPHDGMIPLQRFVRWVYSAA